MRSFATYFKREEGIGLLELMLALAIIAILIVMATRYFAAGAKSQKINATAAQMVELHQAMFQWKNSHAAAPTAIADLYPYMSKSIQSDSPLGNKWAVPTGGGYKATLDTGDANDCANLAAKVPEGATASCTGNTLTVTFTP
jgi:Tfp pilus assembly protein PilE